MASNLENRTIEWRLPRVLTAPGIEAWVAALPETTKRVVVRLGSWERSGPFADARLQGALCLLRRNGIELSAVVPPITLTGDRAMEAFSDPHPLQAIRPLTPTELRLAGSVAGLSIGQLCDFEKGHSEIPKLQRETLIRRRYLFGWGAELALVVPTDSKLTGFPRRPALNREATFNNRLGDLLEPLGVSVTNAPPAIGRWFNDLKTFAFEASENTWEHGRLDFDARPIQSLRFVRLRRIDIRDRGFDITQVAPGFEEPFEKYLQALHAARDLPMKWGRDGGRLVEVTIADGGVGIAARMAGGFDVFNGPLEVETHYVLDSLLPGGTTKSPNEPGRGQGFRKMLRACSRLSGLAIVRTGRLRLSRTYRQTDGSNEAASIINSSPDAYVPEVSVADLPLLAGTAVSLIFPIDPLSGKRRSEDS